MADKKTEKNSEAASNEEPTKKKPGIISQILPLALTIVLMPALAYATTMFVLVPQLKEAVNVAAKTPHEKSKDKDSGHTDDSHKAPKSKAGSHDDKHGGGHGGKSKSSSKTLEFPNIVVNVKNTLGMRYLVADMTLVGADDTFSSAIEARVPELQDTANAILRQKSIQSLEQNLAQATIKAELLEAFNMALSDGKGPLVQKIWFRRFSVQ